jgi:uncharacterized coiled-coil protein SlyX
MPGIGEIYMKKLLIMCIFALTLFFPGTNGFSDILKDLQNFQESLGDWVAQTKELSKRLSELEGERETRDKQIADYNKSMANIESLITDLNAKVEKVEKMGSLEGVKDVVESFEGTLNVFKNRFSEMAKRLEDQEVKTAVLERIYQTTQKPIDTLLKTMDEQKSIINKLAERLDKQDKLILSVEDSLKKQTFPAESFTKGVEELNARLSKLESGVIVQKKELKDISTEVRKEGEAEEKIAVAEVSPVKTEAEKDGATPKVRPKEVEAPAKKVTETDGYIDIGRDFFIKNVKLKPFGSSSHISGEIMNKSDRGYGMVDFKIQTFNEENIILGEHGFTINSFKKDSTKTFEEIIVGAQPKNIAKYAIFCAEMPLNADTGKEEIRIIERKPEVATAETKEELSQSENELYVQKEEGTPEELKGFQDLGNNFYVRNVSFDSFGSSSTVAGEIRNNSAKNYNTVSFIMKIYSKDYGMLTSFDFTVRRLKSGDIKPFQEIITGIRPVDISSYEIVFKKSY